jgi:multiple sugar transport system permease protein
MPSLSRSLVASRAVTIAVVVVLLVFALGPFTWMLSTSLKATREQEQYPPTLIPKEPTLSPYVEGWTSRPFGRYFLNTLLISAMTTALCVALASLCGYGFSRYRLPGSKVLLTGLFVAQMFPPAVIIIPYFIAMKKLGLINTYAALILAYSSFSLPLCVWMLKAFFDRIPRELDEAARIDGCSAFQTFARVILPLAKPGLVATTIFAFLGAWKEYLFALTLTTRRDMYVISIGISSFVGEHSTSWNQMMAMSVISILPVLLIFVFLQRYLISGLVSGAVKS